MDLEKILQKMNDLESDVIALKKAMKTQTSKVNTMDEKTTSFLNNVRDQKNEMNRLNTSLSNLGHLDSTVRQLRLDFNRKIEETEKRISAEGKMQDNLRRDEVKAINKNIEKAKQEFSDLLDQKLKSHLEELNRQIQRSKELENSILEKTVANDEMRSNFNVFSQEFSQLKKMSNTVSIEIDNIKNKQDDLFQKYENNLNTIRTNESRMTEIIAADTDRKQTFNNFIEQQTLNERDRDRIWKDWQRQFDESIAKVYQLIPELQNQQLELNKSKVTFDEINKRFERRINEVTELYRLLDEKFRQEWATYKSDSEKKWSNISVVLEEKQDSLTGQLADYKERMLAVEDSTHDMQEMLLLMSREIQKGMQSLMNMVNGWMEAFGEIKSTNNLTGK